MAHLPAHYHASVIEHIVDKLAICGEAGIVPVLDRVGLNLVAAGVPRELAEHRCIGWRPSFGTAPYRWEFERDGRGFDMAVEPQVTTNDMLLMIRTALAGGGITFGMEETFLPYIERGELVTLLDDWLPPFTGFYLYFPSRRSVTPKLRALIDHVREYRDVMP